MEIPADRILGKGRLIDHNRMLSEFVGTLESLVPSCDMIEPSKVEAAILAESLSVMDDSMKALSRLRRQLRKEMGDGS